MDEGTSVRTTSQSGNPGRRSQRSQRSPSYRRSPTFLESPGSRSYYKNVWFDEEDAGHEQASEEAGSSQGQQSQRDQRSPAGRQSPTYLLVPDDNGKVKAQHVARSRRHRGTELPMYHFPRDWPSHNEGKTLDEEKLERGNRPEVYPRATDDRRMVAFTDASIARNDIQRYSGISVVIAYLDHYVIHSMVVPPPIGPREGGSTRAELLAIMHAVDLMIRRLVDAHEDGHPRSKTILIYTDSQRAILALHSCIPALIDEGTSRGSSKSLSWEAQHIPAWYKGEDIPPPSTYKDLQYRQDHPFFQNIHALARWTVGKGLDFWRLLRVNIKVSWIPGHQGILESRIADQAALFARYESQNYRRPPWTTFEATIPNIILETVPGDGQSEIFDRQGRPLDLVAVPIDIRYLQSLYWQRTDPSRAISGYPQDWYEQSMRDYDADEEGRREQLEFEQSQRFHRRYKKHKRRNGF